MDDEDPDMTAASYVYSAPDAAPQRRPGATLSPAERKAIADDRRWFLRHRGRTIRLRNPAPGEAASIAAAAGMDLPAIADGFPLRIVVTVLGKDLRSRRPVWTHIDDSAPESVIIAMLDLIESSLAQGFMGIFGREELAAALGIDLPITKH